MNSAVILVLVLIWFYLGYKIYGRFIEKRLKINDKNITPAVKQKDDVDFSPAKKPLLFGHHFASIAGAGPIIGPILAISYFGWLPVVLWITLGSVFIGGVHDFVSLVASVRDKAKGVSTIAKEYLSSRAGTFFGIMVFITLLLIITVFSVSAAESIIARPDLIIPLLTVTITAIILGFGIQKLKWNYKISTIVAIIIVFASIWISVRIPISFNLEPILLKNILITVILLYAGIASVAPIWILLRPRDYLSSIQLMLLLLLGVVGIIIVNPSINAPITISGSGFSLWPILFITVACGAISGFHALISSGTTSKQLHKESHAKSIGYGGMILEGILAIVVTLVAVAGLSWGTGEGSFQFALDQGWIVLFSSGFGNIIGSLGIPLITGTIAALLGAFMVNQFILTSVDTSARLNRFLVAEKFPKIFKKANLKNRILIAIIILLPAWLLAVTHSYDTLWRLFGSSNQLIAAIAMMVAASFFISKKTKIKFIIIPAVFMLITTIGALLYLTFRTGGYLSEGNLILMVISLLMVGLGVFVAKEGFSVLRNRRVDPK
ncbi:carbon starvation protein A [Candidatus Pacearchaeota archaeon]|nr:carbon starvation protein A [Candidatus Pacearchaeota archaeon]